MVGAGAPSYGLPALLPPAGRLIGSGGPLSRRKSARSLVLFLGDSCSALKRADPTAPPAALTSIFGRPDFGTDPDEICDRICAGRDVFVLLLVSIELPTLGA